MADTTIKPKLQLRSGIATSNDKTPSPATKLLLNHGKPNFTIPKTPKAEENGSSSPLSPLVQNNNNNNYNAYKSVSANTTTNNFTTSTKFNGVFNASSVTVTEKQSHQKIATTSATETENEAAKVVLRRTVRAAEPLPKEDEDESVPEFIRRQRRIQERLTKENGLDFESRRSGYFTHVVISPTATSRTSFMETMASPAVVPSLEIQRPIKEGVEPHATNGIANHGIATHDIANHGIATHEHATHRIATHDITTHGIATHDNATNGIATHGIAAHVDHIGEEEEVARAIEEVNKAVAGEDDEHSSEVVHAVQITTLADVVAAADETATHEAEVTISHTNSAATLQHASGALIVNSDDGEAFTGKDIVQVVQATPAIAVLKNGTDISSLHATEHVSGALVSNVDDAVVVQHVSGALAVNGAEGEPEKTAATVQVVEAAESKPAVLTNGIETSSIQTVSHSSGALVLDEVSEADAELKAMSKLKFDIKADGNENVEVTSAVRTE